MVKGVKDAESYQTLQLKTQAVSEVHGERGGDVGQAGRRLAASLETMSGVDEELIINSQNVLLTFTKVRDEAGKGNDIFTQGTKAALDLSVALGTDLQGGHHPGRQGAERPHQGRHCAAAGRGLVHGGQKDQIAAMVKAGDTMGAQKLILGS
jgi:hypothetical protein